METIRRKLLKGAAREVVRTRRVVFQLASSSAYQEMYRSVYERLRGRQLRPAAGAS